MHSLYNGDDVGILWLSAVDTTLTRQWTTRETTDWVSSIKKPLVPEHIRRIVLITAIWCVTVRIPDSCNCTMSLHSDGITKWTCDCNDVRNVFKQAKTCSNACSWLGSFFNVIAKMIMIIILV